MAKPLTESFQKGIYTFPSFPPQVLATFSNREFDAATDLCFFLKSIGADPRCFFTIRQVHGNRVIQASAPETSEEIEADGIVTQERQLALVVRTADCFPVFFYDPDHSAVGLAHVGWRGAQRGIIQETVQAFRRCVGSKPSRLQVALGPAIRESCYEVGGEFYQYFSGWVKKVGGKNLFDLAGAVKQQLVDEGIPESSVTDSGLCTVCSTERFFSARREGQTTGRFLSVIVIK